MGGGEEKAKKQGRWWVEKNEKTVTRGRMNGRRGRKTGSDEDNVEDVGLRQYR